MMLLRTKLLLLTLAMILLTVLTLLAASEYFSRQTLKLSVNTTQKLAASDLQHIVAGARSLAEANLAATRVQQKTAVKNYLRSIADTLQSKVRLLQAGHPPEEAARLIREELLQVKIGETGYVFGMNSQGVLTIHPKSEGKDLSKAAHIQEMARKKEGFITYHSITAQRDKAVFYRYVEPLDLIIAPGVFIDEMAGLYDLQAEQKLWDEFLRQLGEVNIGDTGSVWILQTSDTGPDDFLLPPREVDAASFPVAAVRQMSDARNGTKATLFPVTLPGQTLMTATVQVPEQGWILGAGVPENELLKASHSIAAAYDDLKLAIFGTTLLILLVATLLTTWLTRRSLAPLQRGIGFARQVADGDLTATLEVGTRDEVGTLTEALNGMVESIRDVLRETKGTTQGIQHITGRLAKAAEELEDLSENQSGRSAEMASAMAQISASIREVDANLVSLHGAASDNTASVLELSSSVEEVAVNMQTVFQSGQNVSSAASELAATSRQIAENTRHLGGSAETTASSIAQMDAGIQSVERNAGSIADIAQNVLSEVHDGQQAVDSTLVGMRDIGTSMHDATAVVKTLAERASQIGNIVSVISDVASEVDLLALNAAIIAAQAGAEGRSFAVVAEEIKELAGRTTLSIREITGIVEGVRDGIEQADRLIQVVDEKTRSGEQLAERAGTKLDKVVQGVEQVSDGIRQMAGAMSEQAAGSQSIKEATENVSGMVQQIVHATAEQEQVSGEIQRAADQLRELAEQVTSSTREQSKSSGLIARNTEQMTEMIEKVARACGEQVKSSDLITRSGEEVRAGAQTTWQANQVLLESVSGLLTEIDTLNRQVTAFRTTEDEEG